ncbi:MAG: hypothetical protein ACFB15_15080 [Cyclobacteriaceae bacterium]
MKTLCSRVSQCLSIIAIGLFLSCGFTACQEDDPISDLSYGDRNGLGNDPQMNSQANYGDRNGLGNDPK